MIALTLQCYKFKNNIMNYKKVKRIQKNDNIKNIKRDALAFVVLMAGFWFMLYSAFKFLQWMM